MRPYRQYCPIARASEILGERWTLIIVRNLLNGCMTYTELADAAPGIPKSVLTTRLRELEEAGLLERTPKPNQRGSLNTPTEAAKALHDATVAVGTWAERHLELQPEHCDPGLLLYTWCQSYLAHEHLPDRRVVVRFEFPDQPEKTRRFWFIFDHERSEICRTDPGHDEDLIVTAESTALTEWHLGCTEWAHAVRSGRINMSGLPHLKRALPTWKRPSVWAHARTTPTGPP